jgi:ribosomal protein S18 acetylase RimI-like enzyme
MSVTVREATASDADAIVALAERAWRATYGEILRAGTIDAAMDAWYDPGRTREAIDRDDVAYYVAEDADVVGYVSASGEKSTARLGAIYVDPRRWREGIGSALFDRFEEWCRTRGYERVEFEVLAENDVGGSFYQDRGFEVVETRDVDLFGETVRERVFAGAVE